MARRDRARLTASEGRRFGLPVGGAIAVLGGLLLWRGHDRLALAFAIAGGLLFLAGLVVPTRLGPVERAWMGMARAISKVTTPVFMSVVYFLVLTPVGLLRRIFARNPLHHDSDGSSHWIRHQRRTPESLRRQF